MSPTPRLHAPMVAAAAALLVATAAHADLVPSGGGSYDQVPLYRALTFGSVNFTADSANGGIDGIDYASNVGPMGLARNTTFIQAHGATFSSQGAAAYAGLYAGRNHAQMSVTNANAGDLYYQVAGQGTATSVRFFTPEAAAARAVFTWHVSGTSSNPAGLGQTNCPMPVPPPGCFPPATGRLDFGASTDPAANWLHLFSDPDDLLDSITRFGPGTYTYTLPIADLGSVINLFYWSSAYTQINAGEAPQGGSFTLTADYFSTYVLEDVQLLDAAGQPIPEWTLRDLNADAVMFDQDGRVAPVAPPPDLAVPEPASLMLVAMGMAGALRARRRRMPRG